MYSTENKKLKKSMFFKVTLLSAFLFSSVTLFAQKQPDTITVWRNAVAKTKEDTSRVNALLDIAHYCVDIAPLRGIEVANEALDMSSKLNWVKGTHNTYAVLGKLYGQVNNFPTALENFNKALSLAEKTKDEHAVSSYLNSIGLLYSGKGDFEKALEYLEKQSAHDQKAGIPITSTMMLNYGTIYFRNKDFDKAIEYFQLALDKANGEQKSTTTIARIYSNMSAVYAKQKKFDKSLQYAVKGEQMAIESGNKFNMALTQISIGATYKHLYNPENMAGMPDSLRNRAANLAKSLQYLNKALLVGSELRNKDILQKIYFNLATVYEYAGNQQQSIHFHKEYELITDSLHSLGKEKEFARIEAEFKVQRTTDSLKYVAVLQEKEVKQRKLERNIYALLIGSLGIVIILLINRQKLKHIQKRKIAEGLAKQQLEDFTKSIHEKNSLIEKFTEEIERYQALPCSNELPEKDLSLQTLLNSVILTEDQWVSFQSMFDKVHTGYISRARAKFKDMTAAELRFLLLSKLGLTYKEMAGTLGVSIDAVRISKHRLLKKIQLPDGVNFEEIVHSI